MLNSIRIWGFAGNREKKNFNWTQCHEKGILPGSYNIDCHSHTVQIRYTVVDMGLDVMQQHYQGMWIISKMAQVFPGSSNQIEKVIKLEFKQGEWMEI